MKQLTGNEVRKLFLDYFNKNGHMIEPGASLVPHNDPTLLWINAGVAALKKYFDGSIKPKNPRICNAQKSIRTNDIENVGKTARHHTFFEMLGNFSIGDYFKEDAIRFAWEFLTSEQYLGFDKEKLYITVYSEDSEAYDIWINKLNIDPTHILKTPNNFWEIGEGPCGPDTEIFYDRGEKYDPEGLGTKLFFEELENDRYIEIWNVVFSQYESKEGVDRSEYKELPQKNIDTGMGLERVTAIIQNGDTNYDTDFFLPMIKATQKLTAYSYEDDEYKMAYRVIADHIRTVTFALADGALFSNEGRGYVLRRVLRRAVRFGIKLNINKPFMFDLVKVVEEIMKEFYPYLTDKVDYISKLVKAEEERFHTTLADGEKLLLDFIKSSNNHVVDGPTAFKLYDTYGFPFELTQEIAIEHNFDVDKIGFEQEMKKQRERAKSSRIEAQSMSSQSIDLLNFTLDSEFIGYDNSCCEAKVIGLFKDGKSVKSICDSGYVIFDKTVFYAEKGGQVADSGIITSNNIEASVNDVKLAPNKQHMHQITISKGELKLDDLVKLRFSSDKRSLIKAAHSATHLLQSALLKVVGNHITQAGSFVNEQYLRFDFSHFEKVSKQQLKDIEMLVNKYIFMSVDVETKEMSIDEAKESGAVALFDEKYGDFVRVVMMSDISKELCGGTHVSNTSKIGIFKIVSEESVGSGIRRIIGKVSSNAYELIIDEESILDNICNSVKSNSLTNVELKINNLIDDNARMSKELSDMKNELLLSKANDLVNETELINGYDVLIKEFSGVDGGALKNIASNLKANNDNLVVFLASINDDKLIFVASAGKDAISKGIHSGNLVKEAAMICEGNGGGKPDLAQAGGKNIAKLQEALQNIKNKIV